MNRSLGIERTYWLGDYKSLRVIDDISEIPEELMLNEEFVDAVRGLQLTNMDLVYQTYAAQTKSLASLTDGSSDKINALLELRANTLDQIKNILNKQE